MRQLILLELQRVDPGFRAHGLITMRLSPPAWRYPTVDAVLRLYDDLLSRVRGLPEVADAAMGSSLAFADAGSSSSIGLRTLPAGAPRPEVERRLVSPGFFRTMGVPLLAGRDFTAADARGTPYAAVVSESVSNALFAGQALRQQIEWDDRWFTIVGIVGDVRWNVTARHLARGADLRAPRRPPTAR